ncbi:glycosyltransferase family 4 protein [Butyrivibrio fibrisolvens]|uniref:glycosyltransferase family 4 protein n=1 Tax=Pseudobutyrivibrio ruminis TaxID=46206 RepID=UPI000428EC54|nr:glycosyltransferase family 4 protein [Pseudobutyrivibrio ruminis]MDC7278818.1 glycosyltransferase family 4 protein [Butyrivibrio fibrisolvens]
MVILILANSQVGLYKFRKELLEALVKKNKIYISVPEDYLTKSIEDIGAKVIKDKYLNRRGMNPLQDVKLLRHYLHLLDCIKPDVVLTYTIKPNIYGGLACSIKKIPYIVNVTGLGTAMQKNGLLRSVLLRLYRLGLQHAKKVYFQNMDNKEFMVRNKVIDDAVTELLPGSGVNIKEFSYEKYPEENEKIIFTTIGRIMRDKGIEELLEAAESIKNKYPSVEFRLIGDFDEGYEDRVKRLDERGIVHYLGFQSDVHSFLKESHAVIHASYHEGMSNVLLEASATGRPVIATDVPGCIDTFEPDITGISFKAKDSKSLIDAIECFLSLSHDEKITMGKAARKKVINEFDRNIVIDKYLKEINNIAED